MNPTGAGDVRIETIPDATIQEPTDAIVRTVRACVCGSDLRPYHSLPTSERGRPMGHELIGIVEETGSAVTTLKKGDFVIASFSWQDNTCQICRDGFQTSCPHCGFCGSWESGGLQAELCRIPPADGSLVVVPGLGDADASADQGLLAGLLTLSDVYLTGYHAAHMAQIQPGQTVTVVRPGGVISRVGEPQYEEAPVGFGSLFGKNARLAGGPAPVRAYLEEAIPQVLNGEINPGKVFDSSLALDDVAAGYAAMDARESLKVMLVP